MFNNQTETLPDTSAHPSTKKGVTALMPPPIEILAKELEVDSVKVEFLAGDGSDRCYFRIQGPELTRPVVLMQLSENDAIKLRGNRYDWISISETLSNNRIFVPKLQKIIKDWSALIIEDYGDAMFESTVIQAIHAGNFDAIEQLYTQATKIIKVLLNIRGAPGDVWSTRSFDVEKFVWEMNFFNKYFLQLVCNIHMDTNQEQLFHEESMRLAQFLSQDSKWFVHRDYHSRNIMVKDDRLALIDFQDARLGPASYDLVSLCFDSYVPLSMDFRKSVFDKGVAEIAAQGGVEASASILTYFRPMLLQRQLKAIGSFGYLTKEKKRGDYLKYVTPALQTLDPDLIFDDRWPFLSKTLIQLIGDAWG